MKNRYRERILQEKKKLDPEQVFCSPSYEKLLQSIANEIAGEKFEQLMEMRILIFQTWSSFLKF